MQEEGEEGRWASPWRLWRWWEGGWLGETTEAGERERREREGGEVVKPRIFMKTASVCVFFFFPPLAVAIHRYVYRKTEGAGERRRRRQVKARGGAAHLAVDLQAIKVSVIFFPTSSSLCVPVYVDMCVCMCV